MCWPRVSPWQKLVIVLLGVMIYVPLVAAAPRQDKRNWDNLQQLTANEQVQVVLNDAKSYRGEFQSFTQGAIVVLVATGAQTFAQENVLRVSTKGKSHRLRNAGLGTAVGVGLGAITAASTSRNDSEAQAIGWVVIPPLFGAVGAGVGALLPTGGWHDVYRTR